METCVNQFEQNNFLMELQNRILCIVRGHYVVQYGITVFKIVFSTYSFKKLVFRFSVFCSFCRLCFVVFYALF